MENKKDHRQGLKKRLKITKQAGLKETVPCPDEGMKKSSVISINWVVS